MSIPTLDDRLKSIDQHLASLEGCVRLLAADDCGRITSESDILEAALTHVGEIDLELCYIRNVAPEALQSPAPSDDERRDIEMGRAR